MNGLFIFGAVWGLPLVFSPALQVKKPDEILLMITVRVYDFARVKDSTLNQAKAYATAIFRSSGVEVFWRDGATPEPDFAPAIAEVRIVILAHAPSPFTRNQDPMGVTTSRTMAYVFYDRVEEFASTLASTASFPPLLKPAALGHVIAHELGHLLLLSHSNEGIMRARWNASDHWQPGSVELLFTPEQSKKLRAEVTRWIRK